MKPITEHKWLLSILIGVFIVNQVAIASITQAMGITHSLSFNILGVKTAHAMEILMPVPNDDGVTTRLQMMPTITELMGEPDTGNVVADAKAVMIATGKPFYAPGTVSFDDPVGALQTWGTYANMDLSGDLLTRYKRLIAIFPCNFCCGSPTQVTLNDHCGCAHAEAARGFFKYMLSQYGDTYSNDQLYGEAYRWQSVWYPSGVVEDYLLGTGRGDMLQHKTHGGAGADGMHGIH